MMKKFREFRKQMRELPQAEKDKRRKLAMKDREDYLKRKGAETTMTLEHKDDLDFSETDPMYGYGHGEIIGHVAEITDEKDTPYQKIHGRDVTREHNFHHAEEPERVYRGMPTNPDIPTILIDGPYGKEMWAFYDESNYDNGFKHDPKAYQNDDGGRCAACEGDISLEYARSSRGYRYCSGCWEMSSFTKRGYHAEYSRDSDGRFTSKSVFSLTTAAIIGLAGAYFWRNKK